MTSAFVPPHSTPKTEVAKDSNNMSTASSRAAVLTGYRRLLRASHTLFAGDAEALRGSRVELRSHFEEHRHERKPERVAELVRDMREVEEMMLHNLVQGRLNQRGNYEIDLKAPVPDSADETAGPDAAASPSSCPPKFEPMPIDAERIAHEEELLRRQKSTDASDTKQV